MNPLILRALSALLFTAVQACAQCSPIWTPALPLARIGHATAFDPLRQRIIMFSGDAALTLNDTWEWNGFQWLPLGVDGPSPRSYTAMVGNPATESVVLFGGLQSTGTPAADTWNWDGTSWARLTPPGSVPAPRYGHALIYDWSRGVVMLFGGRDDTTLFGDLWQWDGVSWSLVSTTGPARFGAAVAYDSDRLRIVVTGGATLSGLLADTWEWDGEAWSPAPGPGPSARMNAAITWDTFNRRFIMHGGHNLSTNLDETWEYANGVWTQLSIPGAGARASHSVQADLITGQIVMFGGYDGSLPRKDTHLFTPAAWTNATPNHGPGFTADSAAGFDGYGMIWFGGSVSPDAAGTTSTLSGQTWALDGANTWALLTSSGPAPRAAAAHAADSTRGRIVLYSGIAGDRTTWEWNPALGWSAVHSNGPALTQGVMAFDSPRGVCVYLAAASPTTAELWEWNGTTWTFRNSTSSLGPVNPNTPIAYDQAHAQTTVIAANGSTWGWNGTAWSLLSASGPPATSAATLVYDPIRRVCILHAGLTPTSQPVRETWEWNGAAWSRSTSVVPPNTVRYTGAWDPPNRRLIVQGGHTADTPTSRTDQTWEYSAAPSFVTHPDPISITVFNWATFRTAARGPRPITYQWYRDSVRLVDGPTSSGSVITGATRSVLTIAAARLADAGNYTCQIRNACGEAATIPALLEITGCLADLNNDTAVDFNDYLEFLNLYNLSDPRADFNLDGAVDFNDYLEFLNLYNQGC